MTKELNEILSSGTKVEVIMCADDQMAEAVRATVKESGKKTIFSSISIGGSPAAKAAHFGSGRSDGGNWSTLSDY